MNLEELVSQAVARADAGEVTHIGFLSPGEQEQALEQLSTVPAAVGRLYGGYRGAVRKKLVVTAVAFVNDTLSAGITYIELRDIPGIGSDSDPGEVWATLRSIGFAPEHLGDVFCTTGTWQAVVDSAALRSRTEPPPARRPVPAPLAALEGIVELDPAEVSFPGQSAKTIRATVPSLRLDAVAGAGFPASRTRLAQEIKIGRFKVNGVEVQSPAFKVSHGDVITCRGRGRLTVDEVLGMTKRGRVSITLTRYNPPTTFTREGERDANTT